MKNSDASFKKIYLSDYEIKYCKDCLTCWKSDTEGPVAKCVIVTVHSPPYLGIDLGAIPLRPRVIV
jgi:multimeric flavodoxin WrbA